MKWLFGFVLLVVPTSARAITTGELYNSCLAMERDARYEGSKTACLQLHPAGDATTTSRQSMIFRTSISRRNTNSCSAPAHPTAA